MAGALRKTMVYLGLAEDDDRYDDDEHRDDVAEYDDDRRRTPGALGASAGRPFRRPAPPSPSCPGAQRPWRGWCASRRWVRLNRITTIHPRTYNEAKTIGEAFRDGTPVIMNLSDMSDADAKRLVDFAAGLVFGLHGTIERVTSKVFLLSPVHVEVATEEVEGSPTTRGFFNQS